MTIMPSYRFDTITFFDTISLGTLRFARHNVTLHAVNVRYSLETR